MLLQLLTVAGLALSPMTSADVSTDAVRAPYDFVQNFRLVDAFTQGSIVTLTVDHPSTFSRPRFLLVPGQACLESFPAQCYGTLVRLDDSPQTGNWVRTRLRFDLAALYGYPNGVIVTIYGPRGRRETVRY